MSHPHQIEKSEDALRFILAGNAKFTLLSKASGTRFSYRVAKSDDGKVSFVSVLTGPDNETDYRYGGIINNFNEFRTTAKSFDPEAPSLKAFTFFWRHLIERMHVHEGIEVWHEGRCGRCGRTLTVPSSIENGIGPECAKKDSWEG